MAAESPIASLEDEYCPPLDSALYHAIASDFDLNVPEQAVEARAILDPLRDSAAAEELSTLSDERTATGASSIASYEHSESGETGSSSLSNGFDALHTDEGFGGEVDIDLDRADPEVKAQLLQDLFPGIGEYTVKHTLKKCQFVWQRALDELLTIASLQQEQGPDGTPIHPKGIDAFSDEHSPGSTYLHKKTKRRKHLSQLDLVSGVDEPTSKAAISAWRNPGQDIEFISNRSGFSKGTVSTAYNANGSSIPATITALLSDLSKAASSSSSNETITAHAAELQHTFPSLTSSQALSLTQLTHPSTTHANDLARALTARVPTTNTTRIVPQYAPLDLTAPSLPAASIPNSPSTLTHSTASSLATTSHLNRAALSARAAAAYRRSRSDHLMSGAAAYYAEQSRLASAQAAGYTSAAADALVASQSSGKDGIDLHGVQVADGVRISLREVAEWWGGLGEARYSGRTGAGKREGGFRIVVGRGTHSEGGRSRLGPAVGRALEEQGWRVEKGEGVLIVRGKRR